MIASAPRAMPVSVRREGRWLVLDLDEPHAVVSWAVVRGGRRVANAIAWYEVRDEELRPPVDARRFLARRLRQVGLSGAVGLLTSRSLDRHVVVERRAGGAWARCVATVGLGNALRAGDPHGVLTRVGTINVACQLSFALSGHAALEALALAAEARTAAVLEGGVSSRRTGLPATGTGTDCIAIATPLGRGAPYSGKHTLAGHLVGAAVLEAVRAGVHAWREEHQT